MMLMKELLKNHRVRLWLAIVGVATLVIGASYTMVQQSTRLGADDQPLALVQTAKQQLDSGVRAADVVPTLQIDPRTNTSSFVIITDSAKHVLASSAILDGQPPLPPAGTFDYTSAHGSDRFTWEPASGVRLATRMLSYGTSPNNGYIITGQSLAPAEDHINTYGLLALVSWLAVMAWVTLLILLPGTRISKKSTK